LKWIIYKLYARSLFMRLLILLCSISFILSCQSKDPINLALKNELQGTWYRAGSTPQERYFKSTITFEDNILLWSDSIVANHGDYESIRVVQGYCHVEYKLNDGTIANYPASQINKDLPDLLIVNWTLKSKALVTEYRSEQDSITKITEGESDNILPPITSAFVRMTTAYTAAFSLIGSQGKILFDVNFLNMNAVKNRNK